MKSGCGKMALCPPKMCLSFLEMKEKIWTVLIFMMGKSTRPSVRTNTIWRVRGRQAWWMWTHYFNAKRWAGCHRQVLDYTMKDLDEVLTSHKIAYFSLYSHWSDLYINFSTNTTSSFLCISLYTKGWFHPFFYTSRIVSVSWSFVLNCSVSMDFLSCFHS